MAKSLAEVYNLDPELDARALQALSKALTRPSDTTFGYPQFREAIGRLVARGLSQADAYESVFITAETIGVDRRALLGNAKQYLLILDEEKKKVDDAMEKRLTEGMSNDLQQLEKLGEKTIKLEAQRADIEAQIAQARQRRDTLTAELADVRERVQEQGQKFGEVYEALRVKMLEDFEEMKKHA